LNLTQARRLLLQLNVKSAPERFLAIGSTIRRRSDNLGRSGETGKWQSEQIRGQGSNEFVVVVVV
jgi:hypothetical protein